ncbi:hypothetical protein NKH18_33235 [Streptomyces sp. M10(2022)]
MQVDRCRLPGQPVQQPLGHRLDVRPQRRHALRGEVRLQHGAHPGVVSGQVTQQIVEQRGTAVLGSRLRVGIGAAEPVVVQQLPHLGVTGDQPGLVPLGGPDPMDCALRLESAQRRRDLQQMCLLEGELSWGVH